MKKIKHIKINLGTDIVMVSPSHPLTVAMQMKRVIDRILLSSDSEFEFNCNSIEVIDILHYYGERKHSANIEVLYYVNGKKVKYEDAVADLERGRDFIKNLIEE